jgi:hypothetical protein
VVNIDSVILPAASYYVEDGHRIKETQSAFMKFAVPLVTDCKIVAYTGVLLHSILSLSVPHSP